MRQGSFSKSHFPRWKFILIVVAFLFGVIYSLPNVYMEEPIIQVSGEGALVLGKNTLQIVRDALAQSHIVYRAAEVENNNMVVVRFKDTENQLRSKQLIKQVLGEQYTVAYNLSRHLPGWLKAINAESMRLGLDLRGGVHFLLAVDIDSVLKRRLQDDLSAFGLDLRAEKIRYLDLKPDKSGLSLRFHDQKALDTAYRFLRPRNRDYEFIREDSRGIFRLMASLTEAAIIQTSQQVIDQTMAVLRNRVNELGIAEPVVQQQGRDRVAVDLPGIQDAVQAKQILGSTATIEFHMVDEDNALEDAAAGRAPLGSHVYHFKNGEGILLKNQIVLKGESLTSAIAGYSQEARPNVSVQASGGGVGFFSRMTGKNIGRRMGIVYVETKSTPLTVLGKTTYTTTKQEYVISAPVIQQRLGSNFQITGLESQKEAIQLALLLRAGALPANINIIEESTVGPSLGQENIAKGIFSVELAFILIVLWMLFYYRFFGFVANLALGLNLLLLVAFLSLLGATLTLPGIAGIVLTVGMAVDANVLIFERIREELRLGMSPLASIAAGYERALTTIIDANVTTLIVAVVLFAAGTGPVKGFAITLIIGLSTSMFTAITFTRGIIHWRYGRRSGVPLSIGIKVLKTVERSR